MKRRHQRFLFGHVSWATTSQYQAIANASLDGSDNEYGFERALVRTMKLPAKFVDLCETRGVATDILRQDLLETVARMRKSARIDHHAGQRVKWYARLIRRVQAQLDQLPSPRRIRRARDPSLIGLPSAPDCWEHYGPYEYRSLQRRDAKLRAPRRLTRTFEWKDPATGLTHPIEGRPYRKESKRLPTSEAA